MTITHIVGARVVTPTGAIESLDVTIADGTIVDIKPSGDSHDADVVDLGGRYLAPGFIDLQINGGWGDDFTSDPRSIGRVAEQLPATGVTAFLPTIITSDPAARSAALAALPIHSSPSAAIALGVHFEGPMIATTRLGAHDPGWAGLPDSVEIAGWTRPAGVAMVTLAPELDGALELIKLLTAAGVVVAVGHSDCSVDQFDLACREGVSMVTHLFNAMGPFSHRQPGLVGATLAGDVSAGLICDGLHVDPVAIKVAWRALGAHRTILVTDAMAALGSGSGDSTLGGQRVTVDESGVRTPDGVLAGSNLSLDQAVRNLLAYTECGVGDAVSTVTRNPANVLGEPTRGRIAIGARADLVVLDDDCRVEMTMIGGAIAWKS